MGSESEIMRSFVLSCEVIKDLLVQNIQASAARGDMSITKGDFAKLSNLIRETVDQGARNSAKQMQAVINKKSK
jgi:hypothetical protein